LKRPQADDEARPSKPNLPVIVFEAMIVGLFLGMVLALIDPRMRSVEEVVAATDLPILGVIPHMARRLSLQSRGRKVQLDPMSDVSEAYRGIRSAVFFGPKGKTILVTSPMRGEGKSTMSANLAIAMAEAGQRVLLLDGDLREPMQHRIFAISNEAGISSVVSGRSSLERAIVSSGIRGLDLLPCGPIPFNPSETINNQTFADLLNDLARRYDHVVVDSPPVMAVTDARILAAMCDLTLLVVRAEFSNKRAAQDAKDGLLGFGANLVGVVVNDGPRNRQRYGYYGGYGRTRGQEGGPKNPAERPSTANPDLAFIPKR
jgi:tyrosine-protein kinase Etk/Wzc